MFIFSYFTEYMIFNYTCFPDEILRCAQDDNSMLGKEREKKAAKPPSFPSVFETTDCHPERRHGAKDLAKAIGCLLDNHALVCPFLLFVVVS